MDFSDVTGLLKEDLLKVEEAIQENYQSDISLIPEISSYLMSGGGKRIRPLLLLLSAKLCGRETDSTVIRHGCVVEYIHAATLLHDDVVDETTVRRGQPTTNSKWGSDASILVGDYLISRAILLLARYDNSRITQAIAEAAQKLVEGGILELTHARKLGVTEEHCLDIIARKTASILSVSCHLGALLADVDQKSVDTLVAFGNDFGIAFQLIDDVMDYDSSEDLLGKPVGTDLKEGHVTLPLLHLYQNGSSALKKEIENFVNNEHLTEKELDYIVERMRETKSIDYTLDLARDYMDRAKSRLKKTSFASPDFLPALDAVSDYILDRHTAVLKPCP